VGSSGPLVNTLQSMHRVGIDTPIFIYHIQQSTPWNMAASAVLRAVADGHYEGIASVITLLEITVQPLRVGRPEIADVYEALLRDIPNLTIVDVDSRVTRIAAELRAAYGLRTPDAVQIAACLAHGAETFITNDRRLRRVTEIDVRMLADLA